MLEDDLRSNRLYITGPSVRDITHSLLYFGFDAQKWADTIGITTDSTHSQIIQHPSASVEANIEAS